MPTLPFDDENRPIFTVGQVSAMLEVQQAFLRRLDQLGVVRPSRSDGRQRRYTRGVMRCGRSSPSGATAISPSEVTGPSGRLEGIRACLAAQAVRGRLSGRG
jgi:hypothetical protein